MGTSPHAAGRGEGLAVTQVAQVVYIAGWGRSGSTLLDRVLGQLDDVVSVGEVRDIWRRGVVENRLCGCGAPFLECPFWAKVGQVAFDGWDSLDLDDVARLRRTVDRPWVVPGLLAPWTLTPARRRDVQRYADLLARLYAAIDEVSSGARIVDSTKIPSFSLLLRLAGVRQHVLHLVRDSRGVMHSWRKEVARPDSTEGADAMLRYGVVTGSVRYVLYNLTAHVLDRRDVPYRRVRYEDLTHDPARTLSEIAGFAGLAATPEMLAALEQRSCRLVPTHTVDGNPNRFSVGEVQIRADDAWRRSLPRWPRIAVTVLTSPLLFRYGYLSKRAGSTNEGRDAR